MRPGRMGRHIWFRTPTKDDRSDIFDLYLRKVEHEPDLDPERRRDELARITNGYSPAMIEQVCSMALTFAHSDGRMEFGWHDIVEAMTTIESGTAISVDYVPDETRAVAIHEAGHAVASHVYMKDVLSTRLSIRKRGGSLGHHQAIEKEERFSSWRSEEFGKLVWTLGAMAAEHVFYGENSTGVGGDVESATVRAAWMVGICGMGPEPIDLAGRVPDEEREEREKELMERFETHRPAAHEPRRTAARCRATRSPRCSATRASARRAAQILGQAYVAAQALIEANRDEVEAIAEMLIERRELHGDEVVALLERHRLTQPEFDLTDDDRLAEAVSERAARTAPARARGAPDGAARADGAGRRPAAPAAPPSSTPSASASSRGALIFLAVPAAGAGDGLRARERRTGTSGPKWATFKPTSDGVDSGARQIADYVGRQYRLPTGEQIVAVTGGPMELQELPMKIAVRDRSPTAATSSCSTARACCTACAAWGRSARSPRASRRSERPLLLRREALELALYSFHDLDDIDHVVVFMPPAKGEDPTVALHFGRGDVAGQLARPLKATLPLPVPNPDTITTAPDTPFIERLTFGNLFKFSLTTGNQDANVFLVLDPLPTES